LAHSAGPGSPWCRTECEPTIKSITSHKPRNITLRAFAAVASASVAAAPTASADTILPVPGSGPADQAIQQLQSLGYNVSKPAQFDTVYVDVACPNAK
jgi:hypothetical protein